MKKSSPCQTAVQANPNATLSTLLGSTAPMARLNDASLKQERLHPRNSDSSDLPSVTSRRMAEQAVGEV
jgi:hypothetical protein